MGLVTVRATLERLDEAVLIMRDKTSIAEHGPPTSTVCVLRDVGVFLEGERTGDWTP